MTAKSVEETGEVLKTLDANGDGHLTKAELDEAVKQGNADAKKLYDKIVALFSKYDKDGDGTITKGELKKVMMDLSQKKGATNQKPLSDSEVEFAFMHADKNSDKKIDVAEFVAWVTGKNDTAYEGRVIDHARMDLETKTKPLKGPERFFYDKSTYTGVSAKGGPSVDDRHGLETQLRPHAPHEAPDGKRRPSGGNIAKQSAAPTDRHERLASASAPHASDDEADWGAVQDMFTAFAGKDMDGTEFAKICRDCKLFDKHFIKEDVDSIFAKVVQRPAKRIGFEQFKDALRIIAGKKKRSVSEVQRIVEESAGPVKTGTKADYVKFHDDKNTYTGVHTRGGPSTEDDSHNLMDQCRSGFRHAAAPAATASERPPSRK